MVAKTKPKRQIHPAQSQRRQPGLEYKMHPLPESQPKNSREGRLTGKVALVTGGDSGIGRAVALSFAQEGAAVAIMYLDEHTDARETKRMVEEMGGDCLTIAGDIGVEKFCQRTVKDVVKYFKKLDILVNNAAEQHPAKSIAEISQKQLLKTFQTNLFSQFYLVKAALPHMKEGAAIINTTSVTAYRGSPNLLDYSATKGAIVAFTRSLAMQLVDRGIRVNAVAPGPIWTPLIPATFPAKKVKSFGSEVPMGRSGEPSEVAPCYVFLASDEAAYMTGQVLHPNGGEIING